MKKFCCIVLAVLGIASFTFAQDITPTNVCKITETNVEYETLQDAFAAVSAGQTIALLTDIVDTTYQPTYTGEGKVFIDINDHKLQCMYFSQAVGQVKNIRFTGGFGRVPYNTSGSTLSVYPTFEAIYTEFKDTHSIFMLFESITFTHDVTLKSGGGTTSYISVYPDYPDMTIDLNGKTIDQENATGQTYAALYITGTNVTLKDSLGGGQIIAGGSTGGYTGGSAVCSGDSACVTIESGTYSSKDSVKSWGVLYAFGGDIILDGTATVNAQNYCSVYVSKDVWGSGRDGNAYLKSGTINSTGYYCVWMATAASDGKVVIGELNDDGTSNGKLILTGDAYVRADAGTTVVNTSTVVYPYGLNNALEETGGTVVVNVPNTYLYDGSATVQLAESLTEVKGWAVLKSDVDASVAMVNGSQPQFFDDLQSAVDVASEGDEIVILKDIALSASVTVFADDKIVLDLAGHTVAYTVTEATGSATIRNSGELTIKDSSEGKTGLLTHKAEQPSATWSYANNTITNGGKLTIESGKLQNDTRGAGVYYVIDTMWYTDSSTAPEIVINGGHVYNYGTYAIRLIGYSSTVANNLTINGGMVEGYPSPVWLQLQNAASAINVTVNDGAMNSTAKNVTYARGIIVNAYGTSMENVNIEVAGGTVNGAIEIYNSGTNDGGLNLTITGGEVNDVSGYGYPIMDYTGVVNAAVSGGTFSHLVFEEYYADGYIPVAKTDDDGNTVYGVKKGVYLVQNATTGVKYETLQEALDVATDGAEIDLLADIVTEEVPAYTGEGTVYIDVNTYQLTCGWFRSWEKIRFTRGCGWVPYTARYNKVYPTTLYVYPTFDDAYNAHGTQHSIFKPFSDVTLTQDITIKNGANTTGYISITGHDVIFDLNGYTITQESCGGQTYATIFAGEDSEVVLCDSSEAQTGKIIAGVSTGNYAGGAALCATTGGHMIVQSGTYESGTSAVSWGILYSSGGDITVEGTATINAPNYCAVYCDGNNGGGNVTLKSGTINTTGYYCVWNSLSNGHVIIGEEAVDGVVSDKLVLNGGEMRIEKGSVTVNVPIPTYIVAYNDAGSNVQATVNVAPTWVWYIPEGNITKGEGLVQVGSVILKDVPQEDVVCCIDWGTSGIGYFETIADATIVVSAEDTITLLQDAMAEGELPALVAIDTKDQVLTLKNVTFAGDIFSSTATTVMVEGTNTLTGNITGTQIAVMGSGSIAVSGTIGSDGASVAIGTDTIVTANAVTGDRLTFVGVLPNPTEEGGNMYLLPTVATLPSVVSYSETGLASRVVTAVSTSESGTLITLAVRVNAVSLEAELDDAMKPTGRTIPVLDLGLAIKDASTTQNLVKPETTDVVAVIRADGKSLQVTDASLVVEGAEIEVLTKGYTESITDEVHETMEILNAKYEITTDASGRTVLSYAYEFGVIGVVAQPGTTGVSLTSVTVHLTEVDQTSEGVVTFTPCNVTLAGARLEMFLNGDQANPIHTQDNPSFDAEGNYTKTWTLDTIQLADTASEISVRLVKTPPE